MLRNSFDNTNLFAVVDALQQELGARSHEIYEYVNDKGQTLFLVVRFALPNGEKTFRAIRIENDQAVLGLPEPLTTHKLYNLPDIFSRTGAPIFIVEGEQKADALIQAGLLATTSFGGAGDIRNSDWSPLEGRACILIPDEDKAGEKWLQELGGILNTVGAKTFALRLNELRDVLSQTVIDQIIQGERRAKGITGDVKWDIHDVLEHAPDTWPGLIETLRRRWVNYADRIHAVDRTAKLTGTDIIRKLLSDATLVVALSPDMPTQSGLLMPNSYVKDITNPSSISDTFGVDFERIARRVDLKSMLSKDDAVKIASLLSSAAKKVATGDDQKAREVVGDIKVVRLLSATRIARLDDRIYYALYDEERRVVAVSASGIQIKRLNELLDDGIAFFEPGELTTAVPGVRIPKSLKQAERWLTRFKKILNPQISEQDFAMIIGFMLHALNRGLPQTILAFEGVAGSGKTTAALLIKSLIDPTVGGSVPNIGDPRELMAYLRAHYIVIADNLTRINDNYADELCRLTTQKYVETRKLYSHDNIITPGMRPVIITSTHELWERGDLGSRVLIVNYPAIPPEQRKDEKRIFEYIDRFRPRFIGALLYLTHIGLKNSRTFKSPIQTRLADFLNWVGACFKESPTLNTAFYAGIEASAQDVNEAVANNEFVFAVEAFLKVNGGFFATFDEARFHQAISETLGKITTDPSKSSATQIYQSVLDRITKGWLTFKRDLSRNIESLKSRGVFYEKKRAKPRIAGKQKTITLIALEHLNCDQQSRQQRKYLFLRQLIPSHFDACTQSYASNQSQKVTNHGDLDEDTIVRMAILISGSGLNHQDVEDKLKNDYKLSDEVIHNILDRASRITFEKA